MDDLCTSAPAGAVCPQTLRAVIVRHIVAPEDCLTPTQLNGDPQRYVRHIVHADSQGRYTVVALVWREGQRTPVHGHHTWCAYAVLRGHLIEERFNHDAVGLHTPKRSTQTLPSGHVAAMAAGLTCPHRLTHGGGPTAVSLHVYGVAGDQIATGVNAVVEFS